MKTKMITAVGLATGTIIYQALRHGMEQIDWVRVAVVLVISCLLLWLVPTRLLERKKSSDS